MSSFAESNVIDCHSLSALRHSDTGNCIEGENKNIKMDGRVQSNGVAGCNEVGLSL
jgi:hypothetical protein